jgi:hypothetical protein
MSLLDTVNAMRANITKAEAVIAQIAPLHAEFQEEVKDVAGLDKSKVYFGVNEDGTATLLDFDPTTGAPRFNVATPLPAEAVPAPEPVAPVAENVTPLETAAQ